MSSGNVVAVNVGRARTHVWQDREVTTAIFKQPAAGPVTLGGAGADGDEQADLGNHGGPFQAVYAYAAEDAAWWADRLDREVPPGMFGENLTISGIDVTGALVGEIWQVGATRLQVTAPRIPCAKLGLRFGDVAMPLAFRVAVRPGAYLTILDAGEVRAGDAVTVVERPDHDVTIAAVFRAWYDHDAALRAQYLAIEGFPPGRDEWAASGWRL